MKYANEIRSWASLTIEKLTGAGFITFIISLYILFSVNYDFYKFSEYLSSPFIWIALYAYGIVCSFVIDLMAYYFPRGSKKTKVILYILAGFCFFLIQGISVTSVIAGVFGSLSALLFYSGILLCTRSLLFKYCFAFLIPLALLITLSIDFTEKKNWQETRTNSTYEASFTYFNGMHEIPIEVNKGELLSIDISVNSINGGGYGYRLRTENQHTVPMTKSTDDKLSIHSLDGGTYHIVVTGDDLSGSILVSWALTNE